MEVVAALVGLLLAIGLAGRLLGGSGPGVARPARWLGSTSVERARRELWRRAARDVGLDDVEESDAGLAGRKGRFRVLLEGARSPDATTGGTRVVVSGLHRAGRPPLALRAEETILLFPRREGLFGPLTQEPLDLEPPGPGPRLLSLSEPDPREIGIGDPEFDRTVSVQGSPTLARAVLDADTRRAVAALVQGAMVVPGRTPLRIIGELEDGELRIVVPEATVYREPGGDEVEIRRAFLGPDVLRVALDLAARLEDPPDPARRIAENTRREPDARVRRLNIRMLSRELRESPAAREALLAAREDRNAEVRLAAGTALGEEGREVLVRLAMGEGASDQTAASAVEALGAALGVEDARRILERALREKHAATARACLGALGARGGKGAVQALGEVLAAETDELAAAAADALARTGDPGAEAPLLRALSSGSPAVRLSAARALGRVGTAAAVAPLLEAEARGGGMRAVARQAVAEIQLRLTEAAGAAPGQLSLAGGEAGGLSLASDQPGELSLAEPEAAEEGGPSRPRHAGARGSAEGPT